MPIRHTLTGLLAALVITVIAVATNALPLWAAEPLKPGIVFKDCGQCPELVVVPSGIFIMGLKGKRKVEKPAHRVNITKPFAIGRFEVTFDEWQACIDDGSWEPRVDELPYYDAPIAELKDRALA